jgi:hypothetical protein
MTARDESVLINLFTKIFIFGGRSPIKMQDPLEGYQFRLDYSGEYRRLELVILGSYLQGKPDTEGWREVFAFNKAVPIPKGERIFPHWALLDLYKLMMTSPGIESQILYEGFSLSDLPSLDETTEILRRDQLLMSKQKDI